MSEGRLIERPSHLAGGLPLRRVDEAGERALVRTAEPVNKFPNFVAYLVRQLK